MSDLIHRNQLYQLRKKDWINGLKKIYFTLDDVTSLQSIDAVEVVRCRECKHWSGRNDKPFEVTVIGYCDHPNHHICPLNANWFCADGERREENAD